MYRVLELRRQVYFRPGQPTRSYSEPAHLTGNASILSLFLGSHLWISGCWESKLPEKFGRRGPLPGHVSFFKGHDDVSKEPVVSFNTSDLHCRAAYAYRELQTEIDVSRTDYEANITLA